MSPVKPQQLSRLRVVRSFLIPFLLVGVVFLGIVAILYQQDVRHQRTLLEQESQHLLNLQHELLTFELQAVQSDLLFLANQQTLQRFLSGDRSARSELEHEYISFAVHKGVYDQIRCLDAAGQETVRVNYRQGKTQAVPQGKLQSKATRYYYRQALSLKRGEVLISSFDLNVEHGRIQQPIKPVIRFLTPTFDHFGQKRGLLALNYLGSHLLAKLKQTSASFRGQTMLLNTQGEYLQSPHPSHQWGWLLGHPHSFRSGFPLVWEQLKNPTVDRLPRGGHLYLFQRVPLGRRLPAEGGNSTELHPLDSNFLILVGYISSAVANAHSRALLNQLMVMFGGIMVVVAFLSLYWARSREIRRYHEQRIVESELRLRQLSAMLLAAQEAERRNLSRDLHDELGQQVTCICLDLQSISQDYLDTRSKGLLLQALSGTRQLLKSLHEVAARVRPSVLDDLGLQQAVESFLDDYQQRTGLAILSRLSLSGQQIAPAVGENVYRILQEALTNVASHAQVTQAEVILQVKDQMLHLFVQDRGIGFPPTQLTNSTRLGILGMRERAELLGGQFHLKSEPGEGTQIRVEIPLNQDSPSPRQDPSESDVSASKADPGGVGRRP